MLVGTVLIALIALIVAFPLALSTALYICEYAPARIKGYLVALIDLMAAVPSIVYGAVGLLPSQPQAAVRRALVAASTSAGYPSST